MGNNPPTLPYASTHVSGNGGAALLDDPARDALTRSHVHHVPIHHAGNTRRSIAVFAIIVALILCVAFALVERAKRTTQANLAADTARSADAPVAVEVVPVVRAGAGKIITLPGNTRAFNETSIYARVSGYLKSWNHDMGDSVRKNEVLAEIETPELDHQIDEATAKVAQLKSEVKVANAAVKFAKVSYEREANANKDVEGSVSLQERDEKEAELESDLAKVAAAQSAVTLGQAELDRLAALGKFREVVAPFDGIVTFRDTDIGALVTAGSTSNTTPLFTVSQSNQMRVFVKVPESAVPEIRLHMDAQATSRELPGRTFTGKVSRTDDAIDPVSRTLTVEVLIPNPKLVLMPGMYVQVTFQTSRQNPPLRVPASAMAFSPRGPQVAVVGSDGKIFFHDVTISRDMGDAVELGSGVNEGDLVALNVGNQVVDGEKVDAHRVEAAPAKVGPAAHSPKVAANKPASAQLGR
ncbi:MAG TPA: efflux RND transporter periplasmic adaptor subunit [Tepidisphaeraceae bacterium]|nr:efflux RND transporter periplasmic adaptor subunit [Tepidisphaeraceae bacterium]